VKRQRFPCPAKVVYGDDSGSLKLSGGQSCDFFRARQYVPIGRKIMNVYFSGPTRAGESVRWNPRSKLIERTHWITIDQKVLAKELREHRARRRKGQ